MGDDFHNSARGRNEGEKTFFRVWRRSSSPPSDAKRFSFFRQYFSLHPSHLVRLMDGGTQEGGKSIFMGLVQKIRSAGGAVESLGAASLWLEGCDAWR